MTAARHNPTRRALPGAAVFAPVLVAGSGGAACRALRQWERALAALREAEAEAAVAAYRARDYLPAHEIHAAIRGRWPIPYDFAADPEAHASVRAALPSSSPSRTASTPSAAPATLPLSACSEPRRPTRPPSR